ncbi:MAG: hypothetical protein NXI31_11380 [bacterium]|nr:hypothetical protein [bacterium]
MACDTELKPGPILDSRIAKLLGWTEVETNEGIRWQAPAKYRCRVEPTRFSLPPRFSEDLRLVDVLLSFVCGELPDGTMPMHRLALSSDEGGIYARLVQHGRRGEITRTVNAYDAFRRLPLLLCDLALKVAA